MPLLHVIVLGIIQGLTEFLPVSSSAHLALIPKLLGWEDQGLAFDIALHAGTLAAILIYFFEDWVQRLPSSSPLVRACYLQRRLAKSPTCSIHHMTVAYLKATYDHAGEAYRKILAECEVD